MSDDQERPRPRYGEYATPQQQRDHIRQPQLSWPDPVAAPPPPDAVPADAQTPRRRTVDPVISAMLLVLGLWNVISGIPSLLNYDSLVVEMNTLFQPDIALSDPAVGEFWGLVAAITFGLGWLLTAVLTWRNIRAGRLSWWIAVVGGVVFSLVAGFMLAIPLISDPVVSEELPRLVLGSLS